MQETTDDFVLPQGIMVGLGGRARSWLEVCRRNPDVTLVGCVDIVQEQRERMAEQFKLPQEQLFASLREVAQAVQADFVLDVTSPAAHEAVAVVALASNHRGMANGVSKGQKAA